jgi:hypothetical protein
MSPERKADRFPCPGCSADMEFDPQSGGMKCPFCGQTQALAPPAGGIASHASIPSGLLPVWIGAYRFQGKVYQMAVNARTGEVPG